MNLADFLHAKSYFNSYWVGMVKYGMFFCVDQGLKNLVHARVRVRIVHAEKNVYGNYFSVKIISQLENYLYCFTKTFFAVED